MKICIFNWRDINHPKAGGSEIYFHEIAKRWVKKGNEVSWISGGWKNCKKREIVDGINITRAGNEFSVYYFAAIEYLRMKQKPDIIIDVDNGLPFFSPVFSRRKKILHIHHVHKDIWKKESQGNGVKEKIIALIARFIEINIMPLVYKNTYVITISKSSEKEIKEEKIGREILGIVNPAFSINKKLQIKRTKFPSILFLNRIKRYKGADTLIRAFLKIKHRKEMKNAILYIAGKGDYLEELKTRFADDRIKFLGFVSDKNKFELMEKSWIFVNPSFKEGWGIVNVEANYFGLPVIGSNVPGIKDSVIDGKTGLLFKYQNENQLSEKIFELIKNKKLRNKMGKKGIEYAKSFSWDKAAEQYLNLLKKNAIR